MVLEVLAITVVAMQAQVPQEMVELILGAVEVAAVLVPVPVVV